MFHGSLKFKHSTRLLEITTNDPWDISLLAGICRVMKITWIMRTVYRVRELQPELLDALKYQRLNGIAAASIVLPAELRLPTCFTMSDESPRNSNYQLFC